MSDKAVHGFWIWPILSLCVFAIPIKTINTFHTHVKVKSFLPQQAAICLHFLEHQSPILCVPVLLTGATFSWKLLDSPYSDYIPAELSQDTAPSVHSPPCIIIVCFISPLPLWQQPYLAYSPLSPTTGHILGAQSFSANAVTS